MPVYQLTRFLYSFICLFLLAKLPVSGAGAEWEPDFFKIRGNKAGNLWRLGETVNFRTFPQKFTGPAELSEYRTKIASGTKIEKIVVPDTWHSVTGTVTDSEGGQVAEITVDAAHFASEGWDWTPAKPGFYGVTFTVRESSGNTFPLCESYQSPKAWTVKDVPIITAKRQIHELAVFPKGAQPRESGFGVVLRPGQTAEALDMLPPFAFDFVRLHTIAWYDIEKSKGVFDWTKLDDTMTKLRAMGIKIVGNIYGTPQWASSRPDAPGKGIWQDYPMAYAPAKISDYTDFLGALMKRYPDIKTWEPWNEPHLPGQSIFWRSSPEEFVELQKAAYLTIKKRQPDSKVWLAGIGMRYLPFYRRIMELGAGNFFDILPLHGRELNPEPFNAINRQYNIPDKPWGNGEWHAILFKTAAKQAPTETQLSRLMLIDAMDTLQKGADMIAAWNWNQGSEREFHQHFYSYGERRVSIGGFFRRLPCYEPRHSLVVLKNFMDCFAGKISGLGSYAFQKRTQQASLFESKLGKLLVFWQNNTTGTTPAKELADLLAGGGKLRDWEGRTLDAGKDFKMKPEMIYFFEPASADVAGKLSGYRARLLEQDHAILNSETVGFYQAEPLFDGNMASSDPDKLAWHPLSRYIHLKKDAPSKIKGRFAVSFSNSGMDLLAEVQDDTHMQSYSAGRIWEGDSLQFAIDTTGKGLADDRIQFAAALMETGPTLQKAFAPMLGGDLPSRYTDPPGEVKYGKITISRKDQTTTYRIHIDRDDLYPFTILPNQPVRFSLLVNDNQGTGRAGYLEWASGIGESQRPADYGTLTPCASQRQIIDQQTLKAQGDAELVDNADKQSLRVNINAKDGSGRLRSKTFGVVPGAAYKVSFSAQGNVAISTYVGWNKKGETTTKRLDVMPKTLLKTDKREYFTKIFIMPADSEKASLSILCWKQSGWFEIRDFVLETAWPQSSAPALEASQTTQAKSSLGVAKISSPTPTEASIIKRKILSQRELAHFVGDGKQDVNKRGTRVTIDVPDGTGRLRTKMFDLVPGATYNITFLAQGNVAISAYMGWTKKNETSAERLDVFPKTPLVTDIWRPFEKRIVAPLDSEKASLSILCWKQSGWFEVRDFLVELIQP